MEYHLAQRHTLLRRRLSCIFYELASEIRAFSVYALKASIAQCVRCRRLLW